MLNLSKRHFQQEIREGRLDREGYGRFPTLIYADQGRDLGKVVYQTVDGVVQIIGSWLDASLSKADGAEMLEALVDQLAHSSGGRRPLLAIERSRRPDGESWAVLVSCGQLETHDMYESN